MGWSVTSNPLLQTVVPPLSASVNVAGVGGTYNTGIKNVQGYTGYVFTATAFCPTQSTAQAPLVAKYTVTWYADPQGNTPIYTETWWAWLGNASGTAQPVYGRGAMAGPYMQITVSNVSSGISVITLSSLNLWGVTSPGSSQASDWRQKVPSNMNSGLQLFYTPILDGTDGVLEHISLVSSTGTTWQPMPLFTGTVWANFNTSIALTSNFVMGTGDNMQNGTIIAGGAAKNLIWLPGNAAATDYSQVFVAPRAPMYYVVNNAGGANLVIDVYGIPS